MANSEFRVAGPKYKNNLFFFDIKVNNIKHVQNKLTDKDRNCYVLFSPYFYNIKIYFMSLRGHPIKSILCKLEFVFICLNLKGYKFYLYEKNLKKPIKEYYSNFQKLQD